MELLMMIEDGLKRLEKDIVDGEIILKLIC